YRELGKLVAAGKQQPLDELFDTYLHKLHYGLRLHTTTKKNVNVLHHLMGYFKKDLTADEKQELLEIIDEYKAGYVPLIVPITMINHYVRKYGQPYLHTQYYLKPHPLELKLRNHV
ncbi:MAG: YbgA family protein, partial [Desulfovermiculus sp.]|nr:YbgA family protein [Desulfovermiculus sp.]